MTIKITKTNDSAVIPTRGSDSAAGYDLYAHIPSGATRISAGQTVKIGTGICVEIPEGFWGGVYARSGMAANRGLRPANCVGVIDSDYRGEIIVALHNDGDECQTVHDGDRIAQFLVSRFEELEFEETTNLSDTERGSGGFGSTGVSIEELPKITYEQSYIWGKNYS